MKYELNRNVTKKDCPWLDRMIRKGEVVHRYDGVTYGCIGAGIACSWDGGNPFFELPRDALTILSSSFEGTMTFGNDGPYWEISGPRKYLNIPSTVPDRWRAAMTYGDFPNYKTVVGWGPTEEAARADAARQASQHQ